MLFLISYLEEFQSVKYCCSKISTSRNIRLWKSYKFTLNPNFGAFSLTLLTLTSDFSWSVQDIKLKLSGLSYLIYCNNLANFNKFWDGSFYKLSKWYWSQDFDKFLVFFYVFFLDVPSLWLASLVFSKWKVLRWYT